MTCDRFRASVLASDDVIVDLTRQGGLAAHAESCPGCRQWVDAYVEGAARWMNERAGELAADVVARTSGSVCDVTRLRLVSAADEPLDAGSRMLLADHLGRCDECRTFDAAWARASADLPALAELDPGSGFAAAVLARTSRRTGVTWRDRLRAVWPRLVRRPRFAWEVAYVATLCWLLVFGSPVAVLDWTTARVGAVTADALPDQVRGVGTQVQGHVQAWRDRFGSDIVRAADVIGGGRREAAQRVREAQEQAAQWWIRAASGVADLLSSSWQAVVEWVARVFVTGNDGRTEPPAGPARSSE